MSDDDYENLPIEQLVNHNLWKARQFAYNQLKEIAASDISNENIKQLISNPLKLQKLVTDSNVAAQESGILALSVILSNSNPDILIKTKDIIIPSLVEKGLTSSKINSKNSSTEIILLYIEKTETSNEILELMIPSLNAKSPKQVTATIKAINEIYSSFGCPIIDPKIMINILPKLFEHPDKNVRNETSNLSVTIRSYIGDSFDNIIFPKIKPIQQKDLKKLFDKINVDLIKPTRLLYSKQLQSQNLNSNLNDEDIQMTEEIITESITEKPTFDPYDLEDPIDVLSKLPTNLSSRLRDPIWKERVEVLEEISNFFNVVKIQNDDYSSFILLMIGCLKDVNLQVLTLSCGILLNLANGLKFNFNKYVSSLISPLLERTKEKKKTVIVALTNVLDVCFKYSSIHEILDSTIEFMNHKSPQVKVESMLYLTRCLKEISKLPSHEEVEKIMTPAIRLLQDSQVSVRNSAAELIGTLLKIIGPEKSKIYLEKVDKRHIKKVQQISQSAVVKYSNESIDNKEEIKIVVKEKMISMPSSSSNNNNNSNNSIPRLQPSEEIIEIDRTVINPSIQSSIPSKRSATSPLKENIPNYKNTLTSKSLKASSSSINNNYSLTSQQLKELEDLRNEKIEWVESKGRLLTEIEELKENNDNLLKNVNSLNNKLDDYHNKFTTMSMTLKSKDTQIFRLRSDLENIQIKYSQLHQKNKILKSQLELSNSNLDAENSEKLLNLNNNDASDINRRISILSIDSDNEESLKKSVDKSLKLPDASIYSFDDTDDGWKRATAVTNDLKAKIQRMKARTRVLDNMDD